MFEQLPSVPPDGILGLTEAFKRDPNPRKVNLGVGVYRDGTGRTPILGCVKAAERLLLEREESKTYLPIDGLPGLAVQVQELLFETTSSIISNARAVTAQTPGGTGALRLGAELIRRTRADATVWVSEPTWPNHPHIFQTVGLRVNTYPYFNPTTMQVNFDALIETVRYIPAGDILLLHGCCHNPTGADLEADQWREVAALVSERGIIPFVDFAYQGFGEGLEKDADGLRTLSNLVPEMLIASSFSKNFGLYNERVGALTVIVKDQTVATRVRGHVKQLARRNYSNPPAHGGKIVETVLTTPHLRQQWQEELAGMRMRIHLMRHLLAETLNDNGAPRDFSFITRQRGMFSYTGLTPEQVQRLREEYSIYMTRSGRINVAGLTHDNVNYVARAITTVLKSST